ncbi:Fc.00g004490.m01.CDS01 [Cosmosporella sp. VM-42]
MGNPQKIAVVGAGPVGSLAALYAAQRGYEVEVYELRPDLRDPGTIPLNFTRSINLAISERGINAMRFSGQPELLDHVMATTIPMKGRMIHGRGPTGALFEQSQNYDIKGRAIHAIDRAGLNKRLLDILDSMPNVKLNFNHKLTGADFRSRKAWFEVTDGSSKDARPKEISVDFDLMMGADGAHSAVRYHLMKYTQMNYQQEYIDTLWCEFNIKPIETDSADPLAKFRISPNHLHIWPGKDFMFIAIPSEDGSFTCTLFMPSQQMVELGNNPSTLPDFFDKHFPGVTNLIPREDLIASFEASPHLPLISLKCKPYHYGSSCVIIGDAAHAMVPFYGQGMNAGMEDVRILFSILDKHAQLDETNDPADKPSTTPEFQRSLALAEYSALRPIDAHAINDLALQNYVEMRSSVLSKRYRLRKYLEEFMSVHFPSLGWQTKYSRVSFGNEGYFDVIRKSDAQGKVLLQSFFALLASPFVVTAVVAGYKYRRSVSNVWAALRG